MPRSKVKVSTKEERAAEAAKRAENDRLFRIYMIEIWQWKIVDWQTTWTETYKSQEDIVEWFKAWLKWAKNTNK